MPVGGRGGHPGPGGWVQDAPQFFMGEGGGVIPVVTFLAPLA